MVLITVVKFKYRFLPKIFSSYGTLQRCARAGVQELTPAGVSVFQQDLEQDQEWIFLIGTGAGSGAIFNQSVFKISVYIALYAICERS